MKKKHIYLLVFIILFTSPIFPQEKAESSTLDVPKVSTINVDGKMNEDEWQNALTQDLKGGGSIKFKHDGEYLQIGLKSNQAGLSHVYLTDGKDIYVFHSSASLGMAIYQKEDDVWQPIQKFEWELLSQYTYSEASLTYLKTNSWLANIASKPTLEREYKIGAKFKDGENFRLAAVYVSNPMSPQVFPKTLADDTTKFELLFGSEPRNLNFKKEQWGVLKLKEK